MNGLGGFVAFVAGWLLAQLAKLVIALVRNRGKLGMREGLEWLTKSGGMPSGHTASFVGLTVFLGFSEGFMSSIFVLAVCMAAIVVYDAVNVRRAVGEQGKLLNEIAKDQKIKKKLRVVEGHTVPQVIVGAILGVLVGWAVFLVLK